MQAHDSSTVPQLAIHSSNTAVTMSSREIAELCDKRHDHVMRDIRVMLEALEEGLPKFGGTYSDSQGKQQKCFNLPRDLTMTLITGYNIPLRKKVIDRWMELGTGSAPKPLDYSDPNVVLGVIGHLQTMVSEQKERLKSLDRLEGAKGSMCISDAAKTLNVKRDDLFAFMSSRRWIFKRIGTKSWLAYDNVRHAGYMEHDDHMFIDDQGRERVATRALVTAKGLVKLAALLEQPLH